jgi:energy-converting hydrogenase Eha subunit A
MDGVILSVIFNLPAQKNDEPFEKSAVGVIRPVPLIPDGG